MTKRSSIPGAILPAAALLLSFAHAVDARDTGQMSFSTGGNGGGPRVFVAKTWPRNSGRIGPRALAAARGTGVLDWDQDDCTFQNDNLAHCNEVICVEPTREGDDVLCGEVEVCFKGAEEVPCP